MISNIFFPSQKKLTLEEIAAILSIPVPDGGDPLQEYIGVSPLAQAQQEMIALLHNAKYSKEAKSTNAGLCITSDALAHHVGPNTLVLCHPAPYRAYAMILSAMFPKDEPKGKIHPTAVIDPTAKIGKNCNIGPFVVIGAHAQIGENSILESHVVIKSHVSIGAGAYIGESVCIAFATIGNNVLIKPSTCIGQQGFGFHMDEKGHFDVPQIGIVEIGNDVQIGSNVCIDRGSLGNTVICDGVRIDNLVQIAHNVHVGAMSVIVAQAGIAGSTRLGRFVVLAGQAGLAGHLNIGDHVKVAAQSGLMRDVEAGQAVAGSPAVAIRDWHKQTIMLQKLIKEKKL